MPFLFSSVNNPRGKHEALDRRKFIFSFMKTLGFQAFLLTTDASVGEF